MAKEPVTTVDAASGISETSYENGLTLLVAPRPDDPVVSCQIWYRVGSRDEDVGETGLSHFLEHMMFKGTDRYAKGDIDTITQKNGGTNNASTSNDYTEYHFTFPADRWEVALEMESNRMRKSAFLPDEFEAERNVVLQELHIGLDDPQDVLYEHVESAAFRVSGYHHPVIGWEEEVTKVPRDVVHAYYLRHYTPDRATLVVAGGVDRERVIRRVGETFGAIPRGDVARGDLKEPPPIGETRLTLEQDTEVPRLLVAFRSFSIRDEREPVLDVLSSVLADGKSSRLERRLVETGLAAAVSASNDSRRDDGLFLVSAEPTEGHDLDEVEAAVKAALLDLAEKGPTAEEVALAKAKILAGEVFNRETAEGFGRRLGYLTATTDWRYALRYAGAVEKITPESVRDAARAVLVPAKAVVGRSVPKGGEGGSEGEGGGGGAEGGERRRAPGDKGALRARHRGGGSGGGAGGAGGAVVAGGEIVERALDLRPERTVLDNGLVVLVMRRASAPVFSASLAVRNGRLGEEAPGLDAVVGALLEEGTTVRSGPAVAEAIGAVGGSLAASGGGITVKALSKDARLALDLAAEVATKPAFAPDALERVRARRLQQIAEELDTPRGIAMARFREAVWGEGHPLGRSLNGTEAGVRSIARERVVAHHARFWVPSNAILAIVSDRDPAEVLGLVKASLGAWTGGPAPAVAPPAPPPVAKRVVRVDRDAAQANVLLGHLGVVRTDPDHVALEVMENVFGTAAGFTDRLSKNIRDQKGLAYSVSGNVTSDSGVLPGTLRVYAGTSPKHAALARAEMAKEVERMRSEPPTPEELEGAKAALRGAMIFRCEQASDLASLLLACERYGLGFDYPKRYVGEVERTTADDVLRVAKAHLYPDAMVEVLVGPPEPPK